MFVDTKKGRALIKVNSIKKTKKNGIKINTSLLMMDRTQKKAKAKATHFNREAAQKTQTQMEAFYHKNATHHFEKIWK